MEQTRYILPTQTTKWLIILKQKVKDYLFPVDSSQVINIKTLLARLCVLVCKGRRKEIHGKVIHVGKQMNDRKKKTNGRARQKCLREKQGRQLSRKVVSEQTRKKTKTAEREKEGRAN